MAAHQALLSLRFSRQEHWSGLPFPSPMHESEKWKWSRSVVSNSVRLHRRQPTRLPPSLGFFQARVLEWGAIAFSDLLTSYTYIQIFVLSWFSLGKLCVSKNLSIFSKVIQIIGKLFIVLCLFIVLSYIPFNFCGISCYISSLISDITYICLSDFSLIKIGIYQFCWSCKKKQFRWYFKIVFLFSISLFFVLVFIILFLLLVFGLVYSYFSSSLRCKFRVLIWNLSCFKIYTAIKLSS